MAAIPFNLTILIGAYGLYLTSRMLTAIYLAFCYIGILAMMRYPLTSPPCTVCSGGFAISTSS